MKLIGLVSFLVLAGVGCTTSGLQRGSNRAENATTTVSTSLTTEPQVGTWGILSGCFGLKDAETILKHQNGAESLFDSIKQKQKNGWIVEGLCIEKLLLDQDYYFVSYFILTKPDELAGISETDLLGVRDRESIDSVVADTSQVTPSIPKMNMLGIWDGGNVQFLSGIPVKDGIRTVFRHVGLKKDWISSSNSWRYSVIVEVQDGLDISEGTRRVYKFVPGKNVPLQISSCRLESFETCRHFNSFF